MSGPERGARRTQNERETWNRKHSAGKMLDSRKAWVTLPKFDIILFVGEPEEERQVFDVDTPPVRIEMRTPGKRYPTVISLTHMTCDELDAFMEFMNHSYNRARPICELLDKRAQEAFENGDDSHTRLYRPEPKFFNRELPQEPDNQRSEPEHDSSLQGGSNGDDEHSGSGIDGEE